jgi:hypothetical protein
MKPGGQRTKGHTFERKIANDLKKFFPDAKRGFQTRGGGKEQADVIGTPFHIEAKHHAKLNMMDAYYQAVADAISTKLIPVAVGKQNRGPIRVMLGLESLARLAGYEFTADVEDPPVEIPYRMFLQYVEHRYGCAGQ